MLEPIAVALRQCVTNEPGAAHVELHSNVYRLLGLWHTRK